MTYILHLLPLLLAACLLSFSACTTTDIATTPSSTPRVGAITPSKKADTPTPKNKDHLSPGHRIEIFVKEDPSFDGIYPVRSNGDIIIPKLGRIQVAKLSPSQAEDKIKATLEVSQLNTASVIVDLLESPTTETKTKTPKADNAHLNIYLTGTINQPGPHRIPKRATSSIGAYESLLISGGVGRFGDERKAYILRLTEDGHRKKIPLNLEAIKTGTQVDVAINDHDILVVPERIFGF